MCYFSYRHRKEEQTWPSIEYIWCSGNRLTRQWCSLKVYCDLAVRRENDAGDKDSAEVKKHWVCSIPDAQLAFPWQITWVSASAAFPGNDSMSYGMDEWSMLAVSHGITDIRYFIFQQQIIWGVNTIMMWRYQMELHCRHCLLCD